MRPRFARLTDRPSSAFATIMAVAASALVAASAGAASRLPESDVSLARDPASRAAAVSPPTVWVSPTLLDFGSVPLGESSTRAITVSNATGQTVTLTGAVITDPRFTTTLTPPVVIPDGAQMNFFVRYAPTTATFDQATLTLVGDAAGGIPSVSLRGIGGNAGEAILGAGRVIIAPRGESAGDQFGISAASAGDVNGDGFSDVIVGAWANDFGGSEAGRAYLYLGGTNPGGAPAIRFQGPVSGGQFGTSVASAGDVNGDGFPDMIVGAWRDGTSGIDAGAAYVFFGGPNADAYADRLYTGQAAGDRFGVSVASAGDVNGDGYDDVIVGAYANQAAGAGAGRAYVYFGGPVSDTSPDWILTGEAAHDQFGWSVGGAGDLNGDGYDDVIVGASQNDAAGNDAGRAYVYFGGPQPDSSPDLTLTGEGAGHRFGIHVAFAGDVNADGYADLMVGADMAESEGPNTGRAYLYLGGPAPSTTPALRLMGDWIGGGFGESVAGAGDTDGDGYDDVLVGAWLQGAGGTAAGRVYLYRGGPAMDGVADQVYTGEAPGDRLGNSATTAGDFDGDGHADVVLGAYFNDASATDAGRAYVVSPTVTIGPVVTAPATISGAPGSPIAFDVTVADPQGDGITSLTASPLPAGASFTANADHTAGTFAWTPAADQEGTFVVVFTASNGVSGSARTTIDVAAANHAPVLTAPGGVFAAEGILISFDVHATDSDGDHVTIGILDRVVGSLFVDNGDNSGRFTWTPGYGQAGEYTITFTARDPSGAEADPAHVTLVVDNVNRAPGASAGGPYSGVVGVGIAFDATASSDPDGDALSYAWDFGDGEGGAGPILVHAYALGGNFVVTLTVSDGFLGATAQTSATVQDVFPARAFTEGGNATTRLNTGKASTCIQIEPSERSYLNSSVDPASIVMISPGTGSIDRIFAQSDKVSIGADRDRNGVDEITACFAKSDMRILFASLAGGRHTVAVVLEGNLTTGGRFHATLEMVVIASGNALEASVAPNPLNPTGTLTFRVTREGPATVVLFDPAGRLVRTLLREGSLPAGYHDVTLDGRGDDGRGLPSGIYFYRVETIEGVATGRIAVLK